MNKPGQNEGLHVLDDFVCEAINNPAFPQAAANKRGQNEGVRVMSFDDQDLNNSCTATADLPRVGLRKALTAWLDQLPRTTPSGNVLQGTCDSLFGHAGGSHGEIPCWAYRRTGTSLEMRFAFYANFTPDDLICKVLPVGGEIGMGATIQFNGKKCAEDLGNGVIGLDHNLRLTVKKKSISRKVLVELITKSAPDAVKLLGGLDAERGWPLRLGTTNDLPGLIDKMFVYAYCVEQAKRSHRGETPLPGWPT